MHIEESSSSWSTYIFTRYQKIFLEDKGYRRYVLYLEVIYLVG